MAAGMSADRIDVAGFCTISDRRFHSYRRDGSGTGHAALLAALT
jgi:copper oxidase (laccase) domain-containing protein